MNEYKISKINIELADRNDVCTAKITFDPPMSDKDSLDGNDQPCLIVATAILGALKDATRAFCKEGEPVSSISQPFKNMRPLK